MVALRDFCRLDGGVDGDKRRVVGPHHLVCIALAHTHKLLNDAEGDFLRMHMEIGLAEIQTGAGAADGLGRVGGTMVSCRCRGSSAAASGEKVI